MNNLGEFIDKLISKTNQRKISWQYIPNEHINPMLQLFLDAYKGTISIFAPTPLKDTGYSIIKEESFFIEYQSGFVYLFSIRKTDDTKFSLAIQTKISSKVFEQNMTNGEDSLQNKLLSLKKIIEKQLNSTSNFIDDFLRNR